MEGDKNTCKAASRRGQGQEAGTLSRVALEPCVKLLDMQAQVASLEAARRSLQ